MNKKDAENLALILAHHLNTREVSKQDLVDEVINKFPKVKEYFDFYNRTSAAKEEIGEVFNEMMTEIYGGNWSSLKKHFRPLQRKIYEEAKEKVLEKYGLLDVADYF